MKEIQTIDAPFREPMPPDHVAETVKHYLRSIGTITEAAARLGMSQTALSNHLNGRKYMSVKQARMMAKEFAFSVPFLTRGEGPMFEAGEEKPQPTAEDVVRRTIDERVSMYKQLAQEIENLEETKARYNRALALAEELVAALKAFIDATKKDNGEQQEQESIDLDTYLAGIKEKQQ